ncbi:MAG TPA: MEDS domain-containing protein [Streptosporangiaceae bacterium]
MTQPGGIAAAAVGRPGHVAHFYGHDDELADSLGGRLGEALEAGAAVVTLATPGHREACERRMAAAGADVPAAAARGAYVALDAASLVRRFLAGGGFDELIRPSSLSRGGTSSAGAIRSG